MAPYLIENTPGTTGPRPGYAILHASGALAARAAEAQERLRDCALCPRACRVDRTAGELGRCRTGALARVESYGPHFGEETPLVGRGGSGTIFFAGCNLACVFCQNHEISQAEADRTLQVTARAARGGAAALGATGPGGAAAPDAVAPDVVAPDVATPDVSAACPRWEHTAERIAEMMLTLQDLGCENVNFVSPSHVVPQILAALVLAAEGGLRLPLVYNSGGYDALATLRLLDGVIDIYMPDMKYADGEVGARLSGVPGYGLHNRAAVLEMHRQVGDLELDERGVAQRGLLVRHLVLPGGLAGTAAVTRFLAAEVSLDTYINIMEQYRPAHEAAKHEEIARRPTIGECRAAADEALRAGLWRLDGRIAP